MNRCIPLLALVLGCRSAGPVVVDAEEYGILPRSPAITGRDGGPSAIAFGKTVWTYGDTVLVDADAEGTNWHTNSFEYADPDAWLEGFTAPVDAFGAPRYFVERTPQEVAWDALHAVEDCADEPCSSGWALWPSAPLYDPQAERAWVLFGKYNDDNPSGIAVGSWAGLDQPVIRHAVDGQPLLFPHREREWANGAVVDGRWLYAFGCKRSGLEHRCALSRVGLDAVDQRSAWRFWDGKAWNPDSDAADNLFVGAPIVSCSWNEALGQWLVVYSSPFSHQVVARSADAITGPWSRERVLFRVHGDAPYDAVHHAELEEQGGTVQWISFSRPTEGWFGAEHVLWRVTLDGAAGG